MAEPITTSVYDIIGVDEASLSEAARDIVRHRVRKWVTYHGEDTVRAKRRFFRKHLQVLGVDISATDC